MSGNSSLRHCFSSVLDTCRCYFILTNSTLKLAAASPSSLALIGILLLTAQRYGVFGPVGVSGAGEVFGAIAVGAAGGFGAAGAVEACAALAAEAVVIDSL